MTRKLYNGINYYHSKVYDKNPKAFWNYEIIAVYFNNLILIKATVSNDFGDTMDEIMFSIEQEYWSNHDQYINKILNKRKELAETNKQVKNAIELLKKNGFNITF